MSTTLKRIISIALAVALLIPSGIIALEAQAAALDMPVEQNVVYHETFANDQGVAKQSGDASLTLVTDKEFDGNADGAALYVSNRTKDYDAADFNYSDMKMEDGKTYTVTVSVYVDEGVAVPVRAQAYLQTIDSYAVLAGNDYVAGEALTLTKEFTVDTSKDTKLRVQSNPEGATVPFYIGNVLIIEKKVASEPANKVVLNQSFEDEQLGGWGKLPWGGDGETVVSSVHTSEGNKSLQFKNRATRGSSPSLNLTSLLKSDHKYDISLKVTIGEGTENIHIASKLVAPSTADNQYPWLINPQIVTSPEWTTFEIKGYEVPSNTTEFIIWVENDDNRSDTKPKADIFIDEVLIKDVTPKQIEEEPSDLDQSGVTFDFESGLQDWVARNDKETVELSTTDNHTEGGKQSILVTAPNQYDGAKVDVLGKMHKNYQYELSAWVKMAPGQKSTVMRISVENNGSYPNVSQNATVTDGEWVKLTGKYTPSNTPTVLKAYIELADNNGEPRSFYVDDFKLTYVGSVATQNIQKDIPDIKKVYKEGDKEGFLIGNAVSLSDLDGVRLELLRKHHNVITAENSMKPEALYSADRMFTPQNADALVDKALAEDLQVHGHVLVWHEQSPPWMNTVLDAQGQPIKDEKNQIKYLGREEALENLKTHITTVMENFGDKVISWDVVNEAIVESQYDGINWESALRKAPWYHAIGPDYLEQAFLMAREVLDDEENEDMKDIKLYYNDYNDDIQTKSTVIAQMVKELNEKYAKTHPGKLLIDGIGMQAHYTTSTNPENVKLSLEKFIATGVKVSITELDVGGGVNSQLSKKEANAQGYFYARLFDIYKAHAKDIERVTFWGLNDATSWRSEGSPLLFDSDLQAKPAYYGVIDPDKFMEEHIPELIKSKESNAKFGTPVIDGTVDDIWSSAPEIPVNQYQQAWNGATGVAKALWDDENLYVLVQVSDKQLDKSSTTTHEQDSVEIFLDQNNAKTSYYEDDDGQYRINFDNETSPNTKNTLDGFQSATKVLGTNYTVEVKIPLNKITPNNGTKLGFDVQINDATDGVRKSVAAWNDTTGQGWGDPSVFGVLTLTGNGSDPIDPDPGNGGGGNTGGNGNGSGSNPSTGNGENKGDPVVSKVSNEDLKKALESAPTVKGKKQVVIEVPKQANVSFYDVQLPTQSLKGQENFVLVIKTESGTIAIPSNMLSNMTENADQVSIRITKVSTDNLDAATREQIGNRPVLDLSLIVGDKVIPWNNPKAPLTISIPYTPTAEELSNPNSIVVWYIADNGKVTTIINSRYDADTGTVVFQTTHFSTYAVASVVKTFGDLNNVTWAKQSIDAMAARDVIKGTSANSFSPTDSINRADYIALLVRALELQGTGENETMFSDVKSNAYYYNELVIAKELGITLGAGDNHFNPTIKITRQDMMVLTARALEATGKQVGSSGSLSNYPDADSISSYAKDSIAGLVKSGVIIDKNGMLAPNDTLTRAEAAVILYRIWNL